MLNIARHAAWPLTIFLFAGLGSTYAQKYDITPLVGATWGGTVRLEQLDLPNFDAHVANGLSYGLAAGFRFDGDDCDECNVVEFRWLRQRSHLGLKQDPLLDLPAAPFRPSFTIDRFLTDFTREWFYGEAKGVRPFVMGSLGAAMIATPLSTQPRFMFGIGTGVKFMTRRHWGMRLAVEYVPIVMHTQLQRVVCVNGCIVVLNGGIMNQFDVNVGPIFRFK